jgi:DNA polymerase III subunit epsilon
MIRNLALDRPLAIVDLETTGTDPQTDRIVELSILKLVPGAEPDHRTRRVNPGIPISAEATAIHGIRDEDVANLPSFRPLARGILSFVEGCDLCGYNLRFDLRLISTEYQRVGLAFPLSGRRIIDPNRIFHLREPRDLASALRFYCGREHDGAHGAAADVLATLAVLDAQLDRYKDLPRIVSDLHDYLRDPKAVDIGEMFTRRSDETIEFAKGKFKGHLLSDIARTEPDYLDWMLRSDFLDDTKAIAAEALDQQATARDQR